MKKRKGRKKIELSVLGAMLCIGLTACGAADTKSEGEAVAETAEDESMGETASGSAQAVVGGADGPTAVFVAGKIGYSDLEGAVGYAIIEANKSELKEGNHMPVQTHVLLGQEEKDDLVTCYVQALYEEYALGEDGKLEEERVTGSYMPVAITFRQEDGKYKLEEYWMPEDGSYYKPSIEERFPPELVEQALNGQDYADILREECLRKVQEMQKLLGDLQ